MSEISKNAKCSYSTLSSYCGGKKKGTMENPPPSGSQNIYGFYIVPTYDTPGYNNLTYDNSGGCSNSLNITDAYGADANKCNQQYQKLYIT